MKTDKDAFVTTWRVDSDDLDITIPTHPEADYDYVVDWGDGNTSRHTEDASHVYPKAGKYQVSITGIFPRIFFWENRNQKKIIAIDQWGAIRWESMDFAFYGCENLGGQATDTPDLSQVRDMVCMFEGATEFNQNLRNWDVGNVRNMLGMFCGAAEFNQKIGNWNVENVVDMSGMFEGAAAFNQDLSTWDVGNVVAMEHMFLGAAEFNQDLTSWNVGKVENMICMFKGATKFNQKIGGWDVENVVDMSGMFDGAAEFNQDLTSWDMSGVRYTLDMFTESGLSPENEEKMKDKLNL